MSLPATLRSRLGASFAAATGGLLGGAGFTGVALATSPLLALAGFAGIFFVAAAALWPTTAFYVVSAIVPIERLGRLTDDSSMYTVSIMRIFGTVALGGYLLHALIRRQKLEFGPAFTLYAAYVLTALLGVFHSTDQLGTVRALGAILGNLMFFFLVINLVRGWDVARTAVLLWLLSTTIIGIYTVYNWHFGAGVSEASLGDTDNRFSTVLEDTSEWAELATIARATGPTSHAAVYAMNLTLTLPFFFYYLRVMPHLWQRVLTMLGLGVVLYNIVLTNTRAAFLIAGALVIFCGLRGFYRFTAGRIVVGLLAGCAILAALPSAVWDRVLDPANYTPERSATLRIRLQYWQAGLEVVRDTPITGIGVGNQQVVPKYIRGDAPEETTVHNEYLMTLMEVGLPGWVFFFTFVGLLMWAAVRSAARLRTRDGPSPAYWFLVAAQCSMLSALVTGLQVDVFHFPLKGWWLVAGISWALFRLTEREFAQAMPGAKHAS